MIFESLLRLLRLRLPPPKRSLDRLGHEDRPALLRLEDDVRCCFPRARDRRDLEHATFVEFAGRG